MAGYWSRGQYPRQYPRQYLAILTEQPWLIKDSLYGFRDTAGSPEWARQLHPGSQS